MPLKEILLTDNPYELENENTEFYGDFGLLRRGLFNEGAKAQLKKVVEDIQRSLNGYENSTIDQFIHSMYWQALLDEVKDAT